VRDKCTTETEKAKFDATDVKASGGGLVENMEVIDGVGASTEFFNDKDVFTSSPDGIDGNLKLDLTGKKKGKFGKEGNVDSRSDDVWGIVWG
jgi:hypothetical protein